MAAPSDRMLEAVMGTAEIYGRQMGRTAAIMYLADLSCVPEDAVLLALQTCRRELRNFPTVADILSRVQAADGRPGPEEAWAMLPKSESDTAVWTAEMAEAYAVCSALIDEDPVAARMAFREAYIQRVRKARDAGAPPCWIATLGHESAGRRAVIEEAVRTGRLPAPQAQALLPDLGSAATPEMAKLSGSVLKTIPGDKEK